MKTMRPPTTAMSKTADMADPEMATEFNLVNGQIQPSYPIRKKSKAVLGPNSQVKRQKTSTESSSGMGKSTLVSASSATPYLPSSTNGMIVLDRSPLARIIPRSGPTTMTYAQLFGRANEPMWQPRRRGQPMNMWAFGTRRVRIILRAGSPSILPVYSAPGAPFFTFITGHDAYCMFPAESLVRRETRFAQGGRWRVSRHLCNFFCDIDALEPPPKSTFADPKYKRFPKRGPDLPGLLHDARSIGDARCWRFQSAAVPAGSNSNTTYESLRLTSFSVTQDPHWEISWTGNRRACLQHMYTSICGRQAAVHADAESAASVREFWDTTVVHPLGEFDKGVQHLLHPAAHKIWKKSSSLRKHRRRRQTPIQNPGSGENIIQHCYGLAQMAFPMNSPWCDDRLCKLFEESEARKAKDSVSAGGPGLQVKDKQKERSIAAPSE